ncbi:MAG: O-antigen ligase domain-containing protein [Tannerellaceae bacterium]|nr:O-antigen ligase domain-containing protein [Tannerellaceae bacterium]
MTQEFINKYFYYFFIFTFIFSVLLYNVIGFKSADELCGLALLGIFIAYVFQTKNWEFDKLFFITILIFLFYTAYSFYIKSNSAFGIITDLIIQMKSYLAFFAVYQMKPTFSDSQKLLLRQICITIWILLLPIGIYGIVDFSILKTVMEHATNYAASIVCLSLIYLYCSKFTLKEKLFFLLMLSAGLASGRSKFYGFFALAASFVLYFDNINKIKINFKTVLISLITVGVVFFVARDKLQLYFVQPITGEIDRNLLARFVLYATSLEIFVDYFPFGSGLASFATHASGVYYSDIYIKYGIDSVWGLTPKAAYFVADTYYPSLAQFGVIGVILYFSFWIYLIKKSFSYFRKSRQIQLFIIAALVAGFLVIENTADASFTSNRGFFMMLFLGLIMSEQYHQGILKTKS